MVTEKVYKKPVQYLIIHIGLGIVAAFYIPIVWVYLAYQVLQLILQRRFFLFEWQIKDGNSVAHTVVKVMEFFIGFFVGIILRHAN